METLDTPLDTTTAGQAVTAAYRDKVHRPRGRLPLAPQCAPFCQYFSAPSAMSFFGDAPVATMSVDASASGAPSSPPSVQTLNGRDDKSTFVTVSGLIVVPKRALCFANVSVSAIPEMPSGNPRKFSMSVVVVSWPPAATPFARKPSVGGRRVACAGNWARVPRCAQRWGPPHERRRARAHAATEVARLAALLTLIQSRLEASPRRVDRGRVRGRARTNDHDADGRRRRGRRVSGAARSRGG